MVYLKQVFSFFVGILLIYRKLLILSNGIKIKMNIDSRVLSFVVLNQLNLKSAGEPFATLLKTCHRKVVFF